MKLCVIGNSHTACVKAAWDEAGRRFPKLEPTFFAAPGQGIRGLAFRNGCLQPQSPELRKDLAFTSGGLEEIVLADYEAFWLVGMANATAPLDSRLSAAVREATLRDRMERTQVMTFVKMIRRASQAPIVASCMPFVTERHLDDAFPELPSSLRPAVIASELTRLLGISGFTLMEQPETTLVPSRFLSLPEYLEGSPRLAHTAHKVGATFDGIATNKNHMNSKYGELLIQQAAERLRC